MSIDYTAIQSTFSEAKGVTRFNRGNTPIAQAYRGLRRENGACRAYLEIEGKGYNFDLSEIKMDDDGVFRVKAETSEGEELIPLSQEAVTFLQDRRDANDQSLMEQMGISGGYYGHNPNPNMK